MATETNPTNFNMDAVLPAEMAVKAEAIGVKKASMAFWPLLWLSILAGAFIAIGGFFSSTVVSGSTLPYGVTRLLAGFAFTVGLVLVVVGGAELFTGNNLIIMAFTNRKVTLSQLIRNWAVVYVGNFIGSIATALIMFLGKQYTFGNGVVGLTALNIARTKVEYEFLQALALGIMCNALVCLAVWLCYSARTTTDKIMAIILPITAFVTAGFEHSVANMYFIPIGIFIKQWAPASFWQLSAVQAAEVTSSTFSSITWGNFLSNLLPVTIGNIIGGAFMVGVVYWFIYLKNHKLEKKEKG